MSYARFIFTYIFPSSRTSPLNAQQGVDLYRGFFTGGRTDHFGLVYVFLCVGHIICAKQRHERGRRLCSSPASSSSHNPPFKRAATPPSRSSTTRTTWQPRLLPSSSAAASFTSWWSSTAFSACATLSWCWHWRIISCGGLSSSCPASPSSQQTLVAC